MLFGGDNIFFVGKFRQAFRVLVDRYIKKACPTNPKCRAGLFIDRVLELVVSILLSYVSRAIDE